MRIVSARAMLIAELDAGHWARRARADGSGGRAMTATSPISRAAVPITGRWRAALAIATCAVAAAGVLTAGLATPA
ncbi:MAG: hypothetical protein ACRDPO_24420, partial [Streptosporangiaceae bacterium]